MALALWVEFFNDLQNVRGRSRNTVLAYQRDLNLYDEFQMRSSSIGGIYDFLKKHNLSARSQARVISCIRTYLKFCQKRGLEVPELRELRLPKVKNPLPRLITIEEFYKLYDACPSDSAIKTGRNQMTLLLLFGLGCRVSELITLNLQDYSVTESQIIISGKGGRQRIVPLTENLNLELQNYLKVIRPQLGPAETLQSLIINDRKRRPSRVDIWRWLSAWSRRAGFSEPLSPHKLRHGCATSLLDAGADLRSIQLLLGHRSIQTTQIYTSVSTRALQETIDQHHPLSSPVPT